MTQKLGSLIYIQSGSDVPGGPGDALAPGDELRQIRPDPRKKLLRDPLLGTVPGLSQGAAENRTIGPLALVRFFAGAPPLRKKVVLLCPPRSPEAQEPAPDASWDLGMSYGKFHQIPEKNCLGIPYWLPFPDSLRGPSENRVF